MTEENEDELTQERYKELTWTYLAIGGVITIISYIPFKLNPSTPNMNIFVLVLIAYGVGTALIYLKSLTFKTNDGVNESDID